MQVMLVALTSGPGRWPQPWEEPTTAELLRYVGDELAAKSRGRLNRRGPQVQSRSSPAVSCGDDLTWAFLIYLTTSAPAVCLTERFVSYDGCWSRGLG